MRNQFLITTFLILIFCFSCKLNNNEEFNKNEIKVEKTLVPPKSIKSNLIDSLIHLNRPYVNIIENQIIKSPLKIKVKSNDIWIAWQKSLGTVTLIDAQDFDIENYAAANLVSEEDNWKNNEYTYYYATVEFDSSQFTHGILAFEYLPIKGKGYKSMYIKVRTK